ncbi:twin-arginine translocase subunit TatC [Haladaptatus sp. DYF46]|uniref:twin-arginine translocase subunit TatC n=1 Tax=Haladaptatus sp. DYF46 TaxID=2886041 RepID=UPI001E2C0347|nr:twin-arginine translocase subunit TatC [Haladaptatus sp. DYF46]
MSNSGSGIIDEDTAQTVASGRETLGSMLSAAQTHLQKVFLVFVAGFIGTFYAMDTVAWPFLRRVMTQEMPKSVMRHVDIVAVTPFDVILLKAKIGTVAGVILAIPVLLFFARGAIRRQGWYPDASVSYWKGGVVVLLGAGLFAAGLAYGYSLFFPLMFNFLAKNAVNAGFSPKYGIVSWTQFVLVLSFSFGLAAEMPLVMSALGYTGIVPYETFRDKWKYAVLGIFTFGAFFSPPDPFTQIMWAAPLLVLYALSLYLTKIVVTIKRGSEEVSLGGTVQQKWNTILGIVFIGGVGTYLLISQGAGVYLNRELIPTLNDTLPTKYHVPVVPSVENLFGLPREQALIVEAVVVAAGAFLLAVLYYLFASLEADADMTSSGGAPPAIDVDELDAADVRAAPPEIFEAMSGDESLDHARTAMSNDNPEKAQAILDRYDDSNQEAAEADEAAQDTQSTGSIESEGDAPLAEDVARQQGSSADGDGNVVQSTAAGMMNAFSEDETTEDDIGGYYYDIAFIFQSITTKIFWVVGIFMLVLAGSFLVLYKGGMEAINKDFTRRVPEGVVQGDPAQLLNIVTLHPVEALIFEVKVSTLLGAVAAVPVLLYFAWPAMKERGIARGNRNVFFVWGFALFAGLFAGSYVGYTQVAPRIISWLVWDAQQANMVIYYRVKSFFWLVFATTIGIGLLADVIVTMVLFNEGGIVSYDTFREHWRVVVIGTFALGGLLTPDSLYTMFLVAVPTTVAYVLGLGLLTVTTVGGHRG